MLYELLSGQVPFRGTTIAAVATKIAMEAPPSLRLLRPEVPAGLEAAVIRCLQKDRAARYPNVAELAMALLPFGPKRAVVHVERITGTLESTAVSGGSWDWSPSPRSQNTPPSPRLEGTPPSPRLQDTPPAASLPSGTIAPMGRTVPKGMGGTRGVLAVVAVLLGSLAVAAALLARAPRRRVRFVGDSGSVTAAPPPPSVVSISTLIETPPAPPPPEKAGPTPGPTAKAAPPQGPKNAQGPEPRSTAAQRRAAPPPLGPAKDSCHLVSSFDSEGNQHFKQECGGN